MLVDAALVTLWTAAIVFGCWLCATAERRDAAAARRRLRRELARHNAQLWQHEDPS